ncbi:MAG: nucleotidyltransferase family protein [Propionibacteriaceae bacterium]
MVNVGIGDGQVDSSPTEVGAMHLVGSVGLHEHAPLSVCQLRPSNRAAVVAPHTFGLETECSRQELQRCVDVVVGQAWTDVDRVTLVLGGVTIVVTAVALSLFALLAGPEVSSYLAMLRSVPAWLAILGVVGFCRYSCGMSELTGAAVRFRADLKRQRSAVDEVLTRYGATNPRLFGSVARGDARPDSDVDLLVDLIPNAGNELLRVAGLGEELSKLLGVQVDVVTASLLRDEVSATAVEDAVAV